MRVLHIVPTYLPAYNRGGPIWSVHNLNKWLVKKGVDVTVYTTDIDTGGKIKTGEESDVDGVKVWYFRASSWRVWEYWRVLFLPRFLPRRWEYSRDLHKRLSRTAKNFDVIHITSTFLSASAIGAHYARKYGKPYVISPRGNLMRPLELKSALKKRAYINLFEGGVLSRAAGIHFTTPAEEKEYRWYNLPLKKAILIPNGIETADFARRPPASFFREKHAIDQKKKIVLFLGRLNWKKGLDTLIPAFARVLEREPDALLVVAGGDDEGYGKKVNAWVHASGIRDNTLFTGMLLGDEKISALQESDVFVLPSYSENFGMAAVEAMCCKLPVVLTKDVGVSPYVQEAGAGLVVEKADSAVADAIVRILKHKEQADTIGYNGRALVGEKFEMSKIADQWVKVYKELTNQ